MRRDKNIAEITPSFIARIEIEKLFGRYDYSLEIPISEPNSVSKIAMLYGDNGTGKTTILKLLFHLLSPSDKRGHRTFLCSVPFSRFSVVFSDTSRVDVIREELNLTGSYALALTKRDGSQSKGEIQPNPDGYVTASSLPPEGQQVLNEIGNLGLSIYFLGDDRMLQSDEFEEESEEFYPWGTEYHGFREVEHRERGRKAITAIDRRDLALRISLGRTATWLRRRSMQASTKGEAEAQQIYANIVETINKLGVPRTPTYKVEQENLVKELERLDERSSSFSSFGLIPKVDARRFIKALSETTTKGLPFVLQVVRSFVDSQKVRLDTLEELYRLLDRFLSLINGFLRDKRIILDAREGISIMADARTHLSPENLSSGEKQLLLLFCNVLMSSESASLFIIDEPELSLNVKWQRNLLDALIDITSGSQCQFLFATHSIELITKHRNQVIKLSPR